MRHAFARTVRQALVVAALAPLLALLAALPAPRPSIAAQQPPNPATVTIPGTIQSVLGCSGDWQPDCAKTFLTYDREADIWQGSFVLPPGAYEYKVALDKTWDENYGLGAKRNGANIPLKLDQQTEVIFRYDHKTHWVADSVGWPIATVIGSFQSQIRCSGDDDPVCLESWLQDPDGDGTYTLTTKKIPAGTYGARVAVGASLDEVYGEGGTKGGTAIQFTVEKDGDEIFFGYDSTTHALAISTKGAPKGDLRKARAHWVAKDTIAWNVIGSPKYSYALFHDLDGKLELRPDGIAGGTEWRLEYSKSGPGGAVVRKFPHLQSFTALRLPPEAVARAPELLKGQLAVAVRDEQGRMVDAAGVQIPGALDDLYAYDGPLGVTYEGATPTLRVWAPTARSVALPLPPATYSIRSRECW